MRHRFNRFLRGLLGVIIIMIGLSIGSFVFFEMRHNQEVSKNEALVSVETFSKEAITEELKRYQSLLEQTHPNPYHTTSKERFEVTLNEIISRLPEVCNRKVVYLALSELSHAIMDEHVYVDLPKELLMEMDEEGDVMFPLILDIENEAVVVKKDLNGIVPSGSQLKRIDQVDMRKIIEAYSVFRSGRRTAQIEAYVVDDFSELYYLNNHRGPSYEIEYQDGASTNKITVKGTSYKTYQNEKKVANHYAFSSDKKTAYFTFNAFDEINEGQSLNQVIDQLFEEIQANNSDKLEIDISRNKGGNSQYGDQLLSYLSKEPFKQMEKSEMKVSQLSKDSIMSYIPTFVRWLPIQYIVPMTRPLYVQSEGSNFTIPFNEIQPVASDKSFKGLVTLKVGPRTMSSACLFAGTYKQLELGNIVGLPTGGYPQHYGNVFDAFLPITGMKVQLPTSINFGNGGEKAINPND